MIRFCKNWSNTDVLKVKFRHVLFAFLIAVSLPVLWMSLKWSVYGFEAYQAGKSSFAAYLGTLGGKFLFIYVFACFPALILGIPTFYILRKYIEFNLFTVCIVASIIAILPNVLIEILSDPNGTHRIGNCIIRENGQRTPCGWQRFWIDNILIVALYGASAGIVFWSTLRMVVKKEVRNDRTTR